MALTDFFILNLSYGIRTNAAGEWFVFNREYMPLGWNSSDHKKSIYDSQAYGDLPLYTKYKGMTESARTKIALQVIVVTFSLLKDVNLRSTVVPKSAKLMFSR